MGSQGIKTLQSMAEACGQQDSEAFLKHLDRYLTLNSVTQRAIEVDHAEMKPEAFNSIRDVLAPILKEIELKHTSTRQEWTDKKQPWYRRLWAWFISA